jgi:peptide deformylase
MLEQKEASIHLYRQELVGKLCRRVSWSDKIEDLIEEMTQRMKERGRKGLAAPQVGAYLQLALVTLPSEKIEILVNPEIVNLGGKDLLEAEGCVSLPPAEQATARVWRSEIAHVRSGTIDNPEAAHIAVYRGQTARTVQHEIDHLQGIFFVDRCQPIARGIVLRKYEDYLKKSLAAHTARQVL